MILWCVLSEWKRRNFLNRIIKGGIFISTYKKQALAAATIIVAVLVSFPLVRLHYGKQLVFSRKPGYYDSAFYLTILGGGKNTIHYTLDGSEPTMDSPVYIRAPKKSHHLYRRCHKSPECVFLKDGYIHRVFDGSDWPICPVGSRQLYGAWISCR